MALCSSCRRLALRHAMIVPIARTSHRTATRSLATKSTAADILSKPSWSVRSLLPSSSPSAPPPEHITPAQLHHLLRLSALPPPSSPEAETAMINTLQSQLQFVRAVQRVDTTGVEPLRAIRDETLEAREENALGLADLKEVLEREMLFGHYQRPKRVRDKIESEAENWDALSTASRTMGKYFVVQSGSKQVEGSD